MIGRSNRGANTLQAEPDIGYLYQSLGGRVVVQLSETMEPALAAKYEAVVKQQP
jgi:hypothetical protein